MKLDEAIKTLRENGYVLNETTAIGNPELILGKFINKAIEDFENSVKEEVRNGEYSSDEGEALVRQIELGIEKIGGREEDIGRAVLKMLKVIPEN